MEVIQLLDKVYQIGFGSFFNELKACYLNSIDFPAPEIIPVDDYAPGLLKTEQIPASASVLISVGKPNFRGEIVRSLESNNLYFPNIISSRFHRIGDQVFGNGVYALGYGSISADSEVGDFTIIHGFAVIGHHVKIGKFVNIGAGAFIGGNCEIEDGVSIGPNVTLLPGRRVGKNADIAGGSVVLRNVRENGRVYGNPAKYY